MFDVVSKYFRAFIDKVIILLSELRFDVFVIFILPKLLLGTFICAISGNTKALVHFIVGTSCNALGIPIELEVAVVL